MSSGSSNFSGGKGFSLWKNFLIEPLQFGDIAYIYKNSNKDFLSGI